MTLDDFKILIETGDVDKLISTLKTHAVVKDIDKALKQFDPQRHDVLVDKVKRKDKQIKDDKGAVVETKPVARLPLAIQRKIVTTAVHFLGSPIHDSNPKTQVEIDLNTIREKILKDNKMRYKFRNIAKRTKSERHSAQLWYTRDAEKGYWNGQPIRSDAKHKLKVRILSPTNGDALYPGYDDYGDMIVFGRGYKTLDAEGKEQEHFDIYTAGVFYYAKKVGSSWHFSSDGIVYLPGYRPGPLNIISKIPIIYYPQPLTDWDVVQELIDALETIISDHNDTNKYNGNPIIFAEGTVTGFAEKGETGKLLIGENGAKVSYLTWDSAPESIKMEIENLLKFIHSLTHTPDVSFENLKNLGYFSTVALQTMFMDAHILAADSEEIFGEGEQRMINYLNKAISVIDPKFIPALTMDITPRFEYYIPKNIQEVIDTLAKAKGSGLMSDESAIRQNPLVDDADAEIEAIAQAKEEEGKKEKERAKKGGLPVLN